MAEVDSARPYHIRTPLLRSLRILPKLHLSPAPENQKLAEWVKVGFSAMAHQPSVLSGLTLSLPESFSVVTSQGRSNKYVNELALLGKFKNEKS